MSLRTLPDLYLDQLRDLYDAEQQLVDALPKMAEAAAHEQLAQAFRDHLDQTRGHVQRLEQVFDRLGEDPSGKTCKAMKGLVKEGEEVIDEKSKLLG
jgi:ferritin-like metal-binding protein YciE